MAAEWEDFIVRTRKRLRPRNAAKPRKPSHREPLSRDWQWTRPYCLAFIWAQRHTGAAPLIITIGLKQKSRPENLKSATPREIFINRQMREQLAMEVLAVLRRITLTHSPRH